MTCFYKKRGFTLVILKSQFFSPKAYKLERPQSGPHRECARTSPFPSRDKGFRDMKKGGYTTCF